MLREVCERFMEKNRIQKTWRVFHNIKIPMNGRFHFAEHLFPTVDA